MTQTTLNTFKQPNLVNPIANSTSDRTIIDKDGSNTNKVSLAKGFPEIFSRSIAEGGKYVSRLDMNGFLNILSSMLAYLQMGGVMTWDSTVKTNATGYPLGAKLWYYSTTYGCWTIIESKGDNNTNEPSPSTVDNNGGWETIFPPIKGGKLQITSLPGLNLTFGSNQKPIQVDDNGGLSVETLNVALSAAVKTLTATNGVTTNGITNNNKPATGCPTPSNATDFANKQYVDNALPYKIEVVDALPSTTKPNTLYFVKG